MSIACYKNNYDIAKLLVSRQEIDVNNGVIFVVLVTEVIQNMLYTACLYNRKSIVKLLLTRDIDVNKNTVSFSIYRVLRE